MNTKMEYNEATFDLAVEDRETVRLIKDMFAYVVELRKEIDKLKIDIKLLQDGSNERWD